MGTQFPAIPDGHAESWYRQLTSPLNALRLVLTIALERQVAVDCLQKDAEDYLSLWPSSLYGILAAEAVRSRTIWDRCSYQIERSLGDTARHFLALPPSALSRLFRDGCQALDSRELAALLWALLNRGDPMSEVMAGRLGAELEIVAVRRSMAAAEGTTRTDDTLDCPDDPDRPAPCVHPIRIANPHGQRTLSAPRH